MLAQTEEYILPAACGVSIFKWMTAVVVVLTSALNQNQIAAAKNHR
jgi:hypothetical protein